MCQISVKWGSFFIVNVQKTVYYEIVVVTELFTNVQILILKTKFNAFYFARCKKRVSVKNNDKISVTWIFLDPIKNRVSVKSVYVEAVYLEVLFIKLTLFDITLNFSTTNDGRKTNNTSYECPT